ncbi:hypothetical protein P7C70_g8962, partial [Phenoliferia sp. Uapishka_3]
MPLFSFRRVFSVLPVAVPDTAIANGHTSNDSGILLPLEVMQHSDHSPNDITRQSPAAETSATIFGLPSTKTDARPTPEKRATADVETPAPADTATLVPQALSNDKISPQVELLQDSEEATNEMRENSDGDTSVTMDTILKAETVAEPTAEIKEPIDVKTPAPADTATLIPQAFSNDNLLPQVELLQDSEEATNGMRENLEWEISVTKDEISKAETVAESTAEIEEPIHVETPAPADTAMLLPQIPSSYYDAIVQQLMLLQAFEQPTSEAREIDEGERSFTMDGILNAETRTESTAESTETHDTDLPALFNTAVVFSQPLVDEQMVPLSTSPQILEHFATAPMDYEVSAPAWTAESSLDFLESYQAPEQSSVELTNVEAPALTYAVEAYLPPLDPLQAFDQFGTGDFNHEDPVLPWTGDLMSEDQMSRILQELQASNESRPDSMEVDVSAPALTGTTSVINPAQSEDERNLLHYMSLVNSSQPTNGIMRQRSQGETVADIVVTPTPNWETDYVAESTAESRDTMTPNISTSADTAPADSQAQNDEELAVLVESMLIGTSGRRKKPFPSRPRVVRGLPSRLIRCASGTGLPPPAPWSPPLSPPPDFSPLTSSSSSDTNLIHSNYLNSSRTPSSLLRSLPPLPSFPDSPPIN